MHPRLNIILLHFLFAVWAETSYGLKSLNLIGPMPNRSVYQRKKYDTIKINFFFGSTWID